MTSAPPLLAVPPPGPAALLESAIDQAAHELDLPARQLRSALARLFAHLSQASASSSRAQGGRLSSGVAVGGDAGGQQPTRSNAKRRRKDCGC
ncbi:MAG TPA: hypothetical protein VHW01_29375 [Polyangiaceae bacterium]|nr:hypothetical protein [Polyangiaceae bacterium]